MMLTAGRAVADAEVALAVLGRAPVRGTVKTRLAAVLGDRRALAVYDRMLARTLEVARSSGMSGYFFASDVAHARVRQLASASGCVLRPQHPGDLGERMAQVFRHLFHSHRRVVLVGTDCPQLSPAMLWQLAGAAQQATAFVAAEDGGYVALASDRSTPWQAGTMPGIRFGGSYALSDTQRWLHGMGEAVTICGRSWDLDDVHDWLRWRTGSASSSARHEQGRAAMAETEILDMSLVSELKDVMGDDFAALVASFEQDGERRIAAMREALGDSDMETLRATAHSFKGSSGNVGAVQVAQACLAMETAAQSNDQAGASAVLERLGERFRAALGALSA